MLITVDIQTSSMFLKFLYQYKEMKKYSTYKREPFFELAQQYIPKEKGTKILDIGAGDGYFTSHLKLNEKYQNIYMTNSNLETIKTLKKH